MMTQAERQLAIRDYISDRRETSIKELMAEFGVSRNTIRSDLDAITPSTAFEMVPGHGGGIRAIPGWSSGRRYLNREQENLLTSLIPGLQPEQKAVMESILAAFALPRSTRQ